MSNNQILSVLPFHHDDACWGRAHFSRRKTIQKFFNAANISQAYLTMPISIVKGASIDINWVDLLERT